MDTYWLARGPGQKKAEGPFALGQIRAMYESGALTARALCCLEGTEDWREVGEELAATAPPKPAPRREVVVVERGQKTSCTSWGCLGLVLLGVGSAIFAPSKPSTSASVGARAASSFDAGSKLTVSAWDGSVKEAKDWIAGQVRDPSSIKYHSWETVSKDKAVMTTVDFTTTNGFGGPSRATYHFLFAKDSGALLTVLDKTNEKVLFVDGRE